MSGIIIYTFHNSHPYFFVQIVKHSLSNNTHVWKVEDFGGSKDFLETPYHTAVREFVEETNGEFRLTTTSSVDEIRNILRKNSHQYILINGRYYLFLCYVPTEFMTQIDCERFGNMEKTDELERYCVWLSLNQFKRYIRQGSCHPRLSKQFYTWLKSTF